jgi:serine/threonine-protein kinase
MREHTEIHGTTTTLAGTLRRRTDPVRERPGLPALPYRGIELAAIGGMSCVYRARDPRTRRQLAIKMLRRNLGDHARAVSTFATEYEVARRIAHEGIVPVRDYGHLDGLPYLILDWVDGVPLTVLTSVGPLPEARAAAIGAQVARALAAAHGCGVIHCDVKPDNIMVSYPAGLGGGVRAQLIDFGVARVAGRPHGRVAGTPRYMAPEQWRGAPMAATDVYALGTVLHELVTGAAISPAFDALLRTMLARGADGRPSCLNDVARRLESLSRTVITSTA